MAKAQDKRQQQQREARLEIVAQLYKKGCALREIRREVMARLDLKTYALSTVHKDVHHLLNEWRENRLDDIDAALTLELQRIDDTCMELWGQWEKSKEDFIDQKARQIVGKSNQQEKAVKENHKVKALGDARYISEIRQQLVERRKLLGLYAPEKKDISGDLTFASLLMESSLESEEE